MTEARDEWAMLDATAQAELVKSGEASREELVAAACRRIERVDPQLGAVPIQFFDEALAHLGALREGEPFSGVPFLMKDVGARQEGQPYYAANRALRDADHRAEADTPLGARFKQIGLVTVGKSSTPEFGLQSSTWPLVYGPTRNPWDLERSAGGSSGGACAAVAAGLVPVAHASDGAGSIRIPAAWCGLVGLKPSRDRVVWRHAGRGRADVEFVVARSLRDTAALLDVLRARPRAAGDPGEFHTALDEAHEHSRVGVCVRSPAGTPVHAACLDATQRAASALSDLGHEVVDAAPASLDEYTDRALHGALLGPVEYLECLTDLADRLGRPVGPGDVEPFLWELSQGGHEPSPEEVVLAERWHMDWVARTLGWFDDFDLLLTPTVCEPAPLLSEFDPARLAPWDMLEKMVPHMAFTEPWNATGQPAISLPLGMSDAGLPVGVQLVARVRDEGRLLRVAASLMDVGRDPNAPRPRIHA